MSEGIKDVFDAYLLMIEEGDVKRSCKFFVTDNRLIVIIPEGVTPWIGVVAIIAFAVSFVGLVLRNLNLFLIGLVAGFVLALTLALVDYIIRRRRTSGVKRLPPDEMLRTSKRNFEIRYSEIVKIKHEAVKRLDTSSASRIILPTLPYVTHLIEFETQKRKYVFMIETSEVSRFIDLMERFVPEKVEDKITEE